MKKKLIFIAMAISVLLLCLFWIYLQTGVEEEDLEYPATHTPREIQADPKDSKHGEGPDRVAVVPDSTIGEEAKPIDDVPEFEPMDAPGWWVWGNVTSSAGEPLADAEVRVLPSFGSNIKHGIPHLHSDPFLGGLYELKVTGKGVTHEETRFHIYPGRIKDVSITLQAK